MKKLLLMVFVLMGCHHANTNQTKNAQPIPILHELLLKKANFPFQLANVNLKDSSHCIIAEQIIQHRIEHTLNDYYFKDCQGDSAETNFKIKDTYIGTVQLQNQSQTLLVVVLNHIPSGQINSKILVYDGKKKIFADTAIDFNIHAMYTINAQGKLYPSKLKKLLNLNTEIALVDFDKDGQTDYQLNRLYHNGSANGIETNIFTFKNNQLKSFYSKLKWD